MKLSTSQLEQFNTDGFLILRQFADHELCDTILELAKVHLKYIYESSFKTSHLVNIHSKFFRKCKHLSDDEKNKLQK